MSAGSPSKNACNSLGQDETRSLERSSDLQQGAGAQVLESELLLSPRVCISRELESGVELGKLGRFSDMGCVLETMSAPGLVDYRFLLVQEQLVENHKSGSYHC